MAAAMQCLQDAGTLDVEPSRHHLHQQAIVHALLAIAELQLEQLDVARRVRTK